MSCLLVGCTPKSSKKEDVKDGLDDGSPQPNEQYLLNDFYNGKD